MRAAEALRYLFGLQGLGIKLGLDNIRVLLAELAHPELSFPSILITGTNGKGSVAAMITAVLRASGLRTGTYTSPHLVRFAERIVIDGRPIALRRLAALTAEVKARIDQLLASGELARHPTFFEVTTAIAFLEFARGPVDVAVVEVGLGGRFDATNTLEPLISVVTTVALEHTRYLGDTLAAIAFEKGSIARPARPLVTGVRSGPALATLRQRARELGARLIPAAERAKTRVTAADRRGLTLAITTARGHFPAVRLPLAGRHQELNAAIAVATLELLPDGLVPDPRAIARGLARTCCPGRLEQIPGRPRLLLDGAHNPHAMAALVRYLDELEPAADRVLLFGCMGDKDVAGLIAPLFRRFAAVVLTRVRNPRAAAVAELRRLAPAGGPPLHEARSSRAALTLARRLAGPRGLVVVCGSLYLVGEVKAILAGARPPDQGER